MSVDDTTYHDDLAREIRQFATAPARVPAPSRQPEITHLLAAAAERTRSALVITDADLDEPGPHIVWVNKAFEELTGYRADQVIGRNPRFLQGPATDRGVLDLLRAMLTAGEDFEGEAINYRADGTPFVNSWRINAISDRRGEVTHYVAVQDDVTSERLRELADRRAIVNLQAALLPALPDRVGEFEIGNHYRASGESLVGGDWCDIVPVDDDEGLLAVVGDVTGHGTPAVASMGQLRWASQFAVLGGIGLADMAASLRRLAALQDLYATLLLVRIEPDGSLHHVSAGHPPALVVGRDGAVRELEPTAGMVGLPGPVPEPVAHDRLAPGEVLVGYTDGLIERRDSSFDDDLEHLRTAITAIDLWAGSARDAARTVVETFLGTEPGRDDTAVLVVRHRDV